MSEIFAGRAYLTFADARTGSSLLNSTLRATKIAGKPLEYFGAAEIDKPWMRAELHVPPTEPFVSFAAWRDYILRAGSENGGLFGASVHWFHAETLHETFRRPGETLVETLRRTFPDLRVVLLRRHNLVAQAVSHHVAIVSSVWNSNEAPERKSGEFDAGTPYDFAAIHHQVENAQLGALGWSERLAELSDITLPLTYEELAADIQGAVRRVLAHIGVPSEGLAIQPGLRKQAGAWSQELERRYREERRARGLGPVGDEAEIGA